MILDFNKPKKVKIDYGFEDGPTGGYMPQMSDDDAKRWKAKRFNKGKDGDRIEIRKQFGATLLLIIVGKDGWNYKSETPDTEIISTSVSSYDGTVYHRYSNGTRGLNVRMSMNGPLLMSWALYKELDSAINEAWALLNEDSTDGA